MNRSIRISAATALLSGGLLLSLCAAESTPGYVDFGRLAPPSDGGQFVEVNLQGNLIALAARLAERYEPDVAEMLRGIKSVRVNVIGVDSSNRQQISDLVQRLRTDLDTGGWQRLVTVREKDQDVGIFLKQRGEDVIEGLVVTVVDAGKEAVLINIVGDIRPEKLADLGERLNLIPLKKAGEAIRKS